MEHKVSGTWVWALEGWMHRFHLSCPKYSLVQHASCKGLSRVLLVSSTQWYKQFDKGFRKPPPDFGLHERTVIWGKQSLRVSRNLSHRWAAWLPGNTKSKSVKICKDSRRPHVNYADSCLYSWIWMHRILRIMNEYDWKISAWESYDSSFGRSCFVWCDLLIFFCSLPEIDRAQFFHIK